MLYGDHAVIYDEHVASRVTKIEALLTLRRHWVARSAIYTCMQQGDAKFKDQEDFLNYHIESARLLYCYQYQATSVSAVYGIWHCLEEYVFCPCMLNDDDWITRTEPHISKHTGRRCCFDNDRSHVQGRCQNKHVGYSLLQQTHCRWDTAFNCSGKCTNYNNS